MRELSYNEAALEAVAEDVTDRQILPFLKRLASSGSGT